MQSVGDQMHIYGCSSKQHNTHRMKGRVKVFDNSARD